MILGYFFLNRGHPIWIGNARGNTYSRNHTVKSPDEGEFWKFSFHEIGIYDLPAMIDFILSKTQQDQLIYVGHSQGVTSAFVMLSERPEYNAKISILHAIAPPIILKHYTPIAPSSMKDVHNMEVFLLKDFLHPSGLATTFPPVRLFVSVLELGTENE